MKIAVVLILAAGCTAALTQQGAGVAVYENREMPSGCRLLNAKPAVYMTELEIYGQNDPYRVARNEAGAGGANALLVRSQVVVGRRSFDCPASSPITDCPGHSGAQYKVIFESYVCTADALRAINAGPSAAARQDTRRDSAAPTRCDRCSP